MRWLIRARGDPGSPLRWTSKRSGKLAVALQAQGHRVSPDTVGVLLRKAGYGLQANQEVQEGMTGMVMVLPLLVALLFLYTEGPGLSYRGRSA